MTVGDFFGEWLQLQEAFLKRSTYEALTIYVERHIIPFFGDKDIRDLRPSDIQAYVVDKLKNGRCDGRGGLSPVSVKKHLSVIRQALDEAVLRGLTEANPARSVKLPKSRGGKKDRTVFLTVEEAQAMLNALRGEQIYPTVVVALLYGLRRSEVLGLRWEAVSFERNTLAVQHTVVKNVTIEASDVTKTQRSRRVYQLLPEVRAVLWELYEARGTPTEGYIFVWSDGRLFRPDYLTRAFKRVLRKNKLPTMRFHDLRHSTASILFDKGWSLEDVKNWLGHTDIETTSNIYLHYSEQRKILLSKDLEGTFKI